MQSEAEAGHHSMRTLSHPTLATSSDHFCRASAMNTNSNNKQKSATGQPPPDITESRSSIATADLKAWQHHLQLGKAGLVEECNHISKSIMKKQARAHMSKSKISLLESQMQELQEALNKENGIRLHEEILAEHEAKVK